MIELVAKKEDCCGCTACEHVCPQGAITMKADEEGFSYPHINPELCVECGLCQKVCAFQNGYDTSLNFEMPNVYATKHKSDSVRMTSSSGGMFTAISDYILDKNGIVYGVAFNENIRACHRRAETVRERDKFRGSKYVQSFLSDTFKQVKCDLESDKTVLFTGTPCQVAGLKSYLNIIMVDTSKLITVDNVCHGVNSPMLFLEYLHYCEEKNRSKIVNYYCRSKESGWHEHLEKTVYENGKIDFKSGLSQAWKYLFYSHMILRPSCYNCKYTNFKRPSDITCADFWGIDKCMIDFDDNKGISLVIVNTSKGQEVFESIKSDLNYRESNMIDCLQPNLQQPAKASMQRRKFWNEYQQLGFNYIYQKYVKFNLKKTIKKKIIYILHKIGLFVTIRFIYRKLRP